MTKRLDTRLESEAAEFLVLGNLLLERVPAYKTYTNMPGYDLVATNPEKNTSAKIQVKSRWTTNAAGFPIKNFGCDFVVFCRLNRGSKAGTAAIRAPEYYVFPSSVVKSVWSDQDPWGKVRVNRIPRWQTYLNAWNLIREFLLGSSSVPGARASDQAPLQVSSNDARGMVSLADFRRRVEAVHGSLLATGRLRRPFKVEVKDQWIEITPESSGRSRRVRWPKIGRVLERMNETGSTRTSDYVDITFHSSYILALVAALYTARVQAQAESASKRRTTGG